MERHMADDITRNLSFLARNLCDLKSILLELIENGVISQDESDEIESKVTPLRQNSRLLEIIQRKDWNTVRDVFLKILRNTGNGHCVKAIEYTSNEPREAKKERCRNEKLKGIWWPEKKRLIKSLHERRIGDKLLIEELHDRLEKDENRMVVITECETASKLTGMGGVGKTLTSTWYAHKYESCYDHVLWIDCGEGSLLTSFKKLTRDLKVQDRSELLDDDEFARKCYEELMEFKCLWIFDNAENYKGEGGMIKVLPKYKDNFFCLITSRSRHWGVKNIGFGKISDLQLDIFTEHESLQFFNQNIDKETVKYTEFQLKELCRLLGNLPLAMQLAVAALNEGKIDLKEYIEKTSATDIENIVDVQFDDYEKKINASVSITLGVLGKEKNGKVAKDILNIFAYIRPDDVILDLFAEVLKLSIENVNEGIELLVKYSLVSKELKTIDEETEVCANYLNIHRLLQQVFRYNFREREKETLRMIFHCNGFLQYKLLPFTKFADAELRKEFPKVKAELLDQQELLRLVKGKRFEESVQLAKFIDQELQKVATKFNYAICLERNEQLEDEIIVLEELHQQVVTVDNVEEDVEMGLLKLEKQVSKDLVGGHLLVSLWKMDKRKKLQEILVERKSFGMIASQEMMSSLLRILNSNLINSNYSLRFYGLSTIKLAFDENEDTKKIDLHHFSVDKHHFSVDISVPLPNDLQDLCLHRVLFKDGYGKYINMIDVSEWFPKKLNKLEINCREQKQIILSLKYISSIENINLSECSLKLDSPNRISPRELTLSGISFTKNGKELSNVKVNEFIDFHNMNRLQLICDEVKKNMSIDLSEESADIDLLLLINVTVVSLKSANGKGRVNIKRAHIADCSLDLSILPPSLQRLSLVSLRSHNEIFVSGGIELPKLKYLQFANCKNYDLSPFHSTQLTHLYLDASMNDLNVDTIPPSANIVRIDKEHNRITGGVIYLDKIILYQFSLNKVEEILTHFNLKQLVLVKYYDSYKPVDVTKLMDKQISTIAIGPVHWEEEEFSISSLSTQVDRKSKFYVFHEGTGKAIEEKDFEKLYLLKDIFQW